MSAAEKVTQAGISMPLPPTYQKLHLIFGGNIYFFGVSKNIDECFQKAYSSAYEWLIKNNCPERRARLRLGHTSRLNIAKLGQPNVVAVSLSNTPTG